MPELANSANRTRIVHTAWGGHIQFPALKRWYLAGALRPRNARQNRQRRMLDELYYKTDLPHRIGVSWADSRLFRADEQFAPSS